MNRLINIFSNICKWPLLQIKSCAFNNNDVELSVVIHPYPDKTRIYMANIAIPGNI